jgi:hypothetical protein
MFRAIHLMALRKSGMREHGKRNELCHAIETGERSTRTNREVLHAQLVIRMDHPITYEKETERQKWRT